MSHIPVLLKEVIDGLSVKDNDVVVDMTVGNAGHTKAILSSGAENLTLVGIDADQYALREAQSAVAPFVRDHTIIFAERYFDAVGDILDAHHITHIDRALFDLGFRSDQIDTPERGFSIQKEGPLDMAFAVGQELNAKVIVNEWEEELLANIIYGFGEETFSRRIAKGIVEARQKKVIETTTELAEIIKQSVPIFYRRGKIHPATKTFQALRITVNKELERLEKALPIVFDRMSPQGRIAIISFHSLEDRIVKNFFRDKAHAGEAALITKKPIIASREACAENPRARSAKLRIVEKI